MESLAEHHLEFLNRYAFEPGLLERWRADLREGRLTKQGNYLESQMIAPARDQIRDLPKAGSKERAEVEAIGEEAIRNGEFGTVILNGGMATRFGGVVKGTVPALDKTSFLGLKVGDVRHAAEHCSGEIPVMLMNSFATDDATKAHCDEHRDFGLGDGLLRHFTQFVSVRLEPDGSIFTTDEGDVSPYGPGHGDFSFALRASSMLQRFLDEGGKYLMLSNVDNLGARVSTAILGHHIQSKSQITVETAPKWPGDVGGSPYIVDGKLQLVEQLRYPDGFDPDIVDVFNTNTFHFDAEALDRDFDLGWYYVEKTVDDRKAVQIERLVGELTKFLKSNFMRVKRTGSQTRFLPIKTPEDLDSSREEIADIYGEGAQ